MIPNTEPVAALKDRISRLEADIERLSRQDALTGLLNRVSFFSTVQRLRNSQPDPKQFEGVLVEIAVRGIPKISGTLGRHVGDYVLSCLAARVNQLPMPDIICARMDQSQFAVFFPHETGHDRALRHAQDILAALSEPVEWLDRPLSIELACGIALFSESGHDTVATIQNAELALEQAQAQSHAGIVLFDAEIAKSYKRRNDVIYALHGCLQKNEMSLRYQPVYDAQTGALSGFEALLRMQTQDLGPVSPVEFIPLAESTGLISVIGAWALTEACRVAAYWPAHLKLAVNISPEQFHTGTLVRDVQAALAQSGFKPAQLELEITESTLLVNSDTVLEQLSALHEIGCSIVLDDFGTGYSSLSYLWKFPFAKLKLDKAFVTAMDSIVSARGVAQGIIGLASNLKLKITAEGIEHEAQAQALRALGVHYFQGFLFGKPTTEQDLAPIVLREFIKRTDSPIREEQRFERSA